MNSNYVTTMVAMSYLIFLVVILETKLGITKKKF